MSYSGDENDSSTSSNEICEEIRPVFDRDNREYYLEINHSLYEDFQTIHLSLIRCNREVEVARANCILDSTGEMSIADIIVNSDLKFLSGQDKIFKLTHWNEPTNYRQKGLGTYLLKMIINWAKNKGVHKIIGAVTQEDINDNPNLINWYKKHGFQIEPPTGKEPCTAKHRICLYLD